MTPHEAHKYFRNLLLLALSRENYFVWNNESGAAKSENGNFISYGLAGSSDIIGVAAPCGVMLAIECKTGRGALSKKQKAFKEQVLSRGGIFYEAKWVYTEHGDVRHAVQQAIEHIREQVRQICGGAREGVSKC